MIDDFVASWDLLRNMYLAGWSIAALLALTGVLVVARDQIFLGAAVSQSSTFGIALALTIEEALALEGHGRFDPELFHALLGGGFAVLAALVTARASRAHRETHEAATGWVFLAAGSGTVLLVAHSIHGLEEVSRLTASTMIGAAGSDALAFAGLFAVTAATVAGFRARLSLLVTDPEMAGAVGMRVGLWETGIYVWLGLVVGSAIHVAGTVYAFGTLVLPALVAKTFCREVRSIFIAAPLVAVASAVAAFVLANHHDYPPAQLTVVLLCALLGLGRAVRAAVAAIGRRRRWRPRR
jgi:ABC-type Mn2+/Zn2+ transport system permease subunit